MNAYVSVVMLAEDSSIQAKLANCDLNFKVQTIAQVAPIQLYPARVLSHLFSHLGQSVSSAPVKGLIRGFAVYKMKRNKNNNCLNQ